MTDKQAIQETHLYMVQTTYNFLNLPLKEIVYRHYLVIINKQW